MGRLYRRETGTAWYADFVDRNGKRTRKSTGTTIRRAAERILAQWEAQAQTLSVGIADDSLTLEEVLQEYLDYLGNASPKYLGLTETRLRAVLEPNAWTRPAQITQYEIETTVRQLRHHKTGEPISLRTQGHYIGAAKSFTRWMHSVRRCITHDPLAGVRKPRYDADRKLVRRFLLPEEWRWLQLTPNATLYATAIQTGLRANELLALQPKHLNEDHVLLPGRYTKNGKPARQYITSELRRSLSTALPFQVADKQRLAKLLRRDLGAALALHLDEGPSNKPRGFLEPTNPLEQTLDFHALRHTCGAWLAMRNVSPKVIQSVMRHSSIQLTLDTYGHLYPDAERAIISEFETLMPVTHTAHPCD